MSGRRLSQGGLIDRSRLLRFRFDGRDFTGHPGDTLASALLASGVRVMGRSFKYHRPRGLWGAWFDDPNAVFNVRLRGDELPNCPATTTALVDGMQARAVNAWPNAENDLKGGLDLFHRWLGAGFYYKTFMWPDWHLFEPSIRKMAGLGAVDGKAIDGYVADQLHDDCDLLVAGGGAAGLAAARAAAEAGYSVVLADDHPTLGGSLYQGDEPIEGEEPQAWVAAQVAAIRAAGGRILTSTTVFGLYDHGLAALAEDRGFARAPRLWRLRARRTLVATGAMDRPITFADNDRPGVMSLQGAAEFLGRYGVLAGQRIAVLSNNSHSAPIVARLRAAGAEVIEADPAEGAPRALGGKRLSGVQIGARKIDCDTLLVSGGLTPTVHLWRHAGGKLDWSAEKAAFVPGAGPDHMLAAGAANGTFDLDPALAEARAAALGTPHATGASGYRVRPLWPQPGSKGRQWIDFQHDVTLKDVELAARENYVSVEHLKRYTTLGMAADQGKTANMAGLAAMAAIQGRPIPEVGTTTFRPPFVPVPMELYHGTRRGQAVNPLKRLELEPQHRAAGAAMGEYGGWLRPAWYGPEDQSAITAEVQAARQAAGVFDGSPLGKIEVMGPDAAAFVNFIYYNTIATLEPGHIRYGFMLRENGLIFDDGVIARLAEDRFLISCSSSHVAGVEAMLESWRQDGNDPDRIFVHDTTQHWATITVTGPQARAIVAALDTGADPATLAHMTLTEGRFGDSPLRIARVSFTGDASFELSVPASRAADLWQAVLAAGTPLGARPIGLEAMSVLRAEKGFIMVGKDTDGETMPHDLGFDVPRRKKKAAFVGDRALQTEAANAADRRQLVGLRVADSGTVLPTGAHIVTGDGPQRSIGFVTSSYFSPTLDRPIALALLESGQQRIGDRVQLRHLGQSLSATVTAPCALDPEGERLNA
ncbi:2Fe-2S iron-sulfur cluster-binding protein [Pseudodonghicola flavimaris]|uniref:2Fe-2S iron-sulfur cluster-binding protein n=1 Tax=Pseudodonghicola flavimaris TaxID=3050036 RepID=A0ABT7F330_9RHOB|nr:2Fe-2S iron-sulfur cluster-binding protein [Pseudodonghicola flavimaris]MDK3019014.1 2Fe-2S iron-sulfur cluster-binding protein [Pseudodonghicola flavimaris]